MVGSSARVACDAMAFAIGEFRTAERTHDEMRLRDAAEKAWLAVVEATDFHLAQRGIRVPADVTPVEMHRFRRERLHDMAKTGDPTAVAILADYLDLRDSLHGDCFYGGACSGVEGLIRGARMYVTDTTGCDIPGGS